MNKSISILKPSKGLTITMIAAALSIVPATALYIGFTNVTPKASAQTINYPMDIIGSNQWYITLPSKVNATPDTVEEPALATYSDEWFHLNSAKDGAVFKVRTDGAHTSGSSNPRSELREMTSNGSRNASWSSTSGTHNITIEQTVNALPIGSNPVVVTGQIHDSSNDITVFRVEGNTSGDRSIASIWITDGNTTHGYLLTNSYKLGTKYSVGFNVSGGKITYTYNGQPVSGYSQSKSFSGAYFKAGSYNQSGGNCTKQTSGPDTGKCDYAEVTIYAVQVCHSGACTGNGPGAINPTRTPTVTPTQGPGDDKYDAAYANLKVKNYTKPTELKVNVAPANASAALVLSWRAAPGKDNAEIIGYKIYEKASNGNYAYILVSSDLKASLTRAAGSYSYKVSAVYRNDDGSVVESPTPSSISVNIK